ncbi:MAG: TolC family protein [Bdellovibrionales bacterium]|nr:TolC family protein [Bdellovibrionales bacterium]
MRLIVGAIILLSFLQVQAKLPPQAQTYLSQIPGQKLTLPFVIETALKNSDQYRVVGLQFAQAKIEQEALESAEDFRFNSSANYMDNNSAKASQFQNARDKQWKWDVGFSKYWATGTKTLIKYQHDWNWAQLSSAFSNPSSPFSSGGFFLTNYKQSVGVLGLEQSLLKNSFGYSYRKKREAARKRGEAITLKTQHDLEQTTLNFVSLFYEAWLTQQQVASLSDQVARQTKLLRVMRRKAQKGAVEKPELIQVEALLASTRSNFEVVKAQLRQKWEALVYGLKLPMEFLPVDPMDIPTQIDDPVPLGLRVCGLKEPRKTAEILSLEKNLEALKADFSAVKNEAYPDLSLKANYTGNSIDTSGSTTFQQVLSGRDTNGNGLGPMWSVGLVLDWPLDNSKNRADRAQKFVEREQTVSQLQMAKDQLQASWKDLCRQLRVELENEKITSNVVREQKKRVKAENRRFSLGRISVSDLVQAEDDLGRWEFSNSQKSVQVRSLAWRVQALSGELFKKITPAVEAQLDAAEGVL